ncbi:unnamed protein product [Arctia plantaginis]|uniref:Uncharacterized protein n=1 Tax=Arctia plantaginis TaxID=874455 RepID=A0A8S0ZY21_ARCPL|nr:unnamed protein product [Arctia plantaginis]
MLKQSNVSPVRGGFRPIGSHNLEATTSVNKNVKPQKAEQTAKYPVNDCKTSTYLGGETEPSGYEAATLDDTRFLRRATSLAALL